MPALSEDLKVLHGEIHKLLEEERKENKVTYNEKLPYQRYDRIQFEGLRWTPEKRILDYGIDRYVFPGAVCLDIGSNTGFLGIELACAYKAGRVDGVEPNSWLCKAGELVAKHLGVEEQTRFLDKRFDEIDTANEYDVILSLAAFYTQDGREREGADEYFGRCQSLLKEGGVLIYESVSYNPDEGGPHYLKAKEAIRAMQEQFEEIETVVKPSGSPGWCREYFIGRKGK